MIRHIVMWRLKDVAEGGTKKENALKMKQILEALMGVVPTLKSISVNINADGIDDTNFDVVLDSTFDDIAGLKAYASHPEHVKCGGFIKLVVEARSCVDFEF